MVWASTQIACVIVSFFKNGRQGIRSSLFILGDRSQVHMILYSVLFCMFGIGYNFFKILILIQKKKGIQTNKTHLQAGLTPKASSFPSLLPV